MCACAVAFFAQPSGNNIMKQHSKCWQLWLWVSYHFEHRPKLIANCVAHYVVVQLYVLISNVINEEMSSRKKRHSTWFICRAFFHILDKLKHISGFCSFCRSQFIDGFKCATTFHGKPVGIAWNIMSIGYESSASSSENRCRKLDQPNKTIHSSVINAIATKAQQSNNNEIIYV